jgi:hypothetical protein
MKAVPILAVTGVALLITGVYIGVDWAQSFPQRVANVPAYAGYARTALCAGVAFMVGRSCLTSRDRLLLMAAFGVTLVADYFLVLTNSHFVLGVGLFLLVHTLLSIRHAQGFRASLAPDQRRRTIRLLTVTALVAFGISGVVFWKTEGILRSSGQEAVDVIYVLALTVSMWMGWGTLIRGFYPRLNAWFIAIGITCFYCCDVSVGLAADLYKLEKKTAADILNNMVGVFYTPALVLLALSGYRWTDASATATAHLVTQGATEMETVPSPSTVSRT